MFFVSSPWTVKQTEPNAWSFSFLTWNTELQNQAVFFKTFIVYVQIFGSAERPAYCDTGNKSSSIEFEELSPEVLKIFKKSKTGA